MDTKTRAFLHDYMKDIGKKNTLHASVMLSRHEIVQSQIPKEMVIQRLISCLMSSEIVKGKIQESIAIQDKVGDGTKTYNSSLYVFTGDELYGILYDLALNIYMLKPSFPKPQTINESLI